MLRVKPFGLMGVQVLTDGRELQRGNSPADVDSLCLVDPTALHHIVGGGGPLGASGTSGSVYRWLGISTSLSFAPEVATAVQACGDAKYQAYARYRHGPVDKHVIHAGALRPRRTPRRTFPPSPKPPSPLSRCAIKK